LPTYRPFLLSLRKEYDGLIQRLQAEFNSVAPLEGRLKTLRAESLSFVGESMTWFQMEIGCLRKRLAEAEEGQTNLREELARVQDENARLQEVSEKDRLQSSESHAQNLDILKHLERCEKQVELLRKQEKELHGANKELERRLKERENRIQTVEEQLNEEREKLAKMVPKEDFESLKEEIRQGEARYKELEESYAAKHKDYLNIVETYSKKVGQALPNKGDMRPLTPRPTWMYCRGLLDPEAPHSTEKAEVAQDLLQHLLACSRTLLSAYGLAVASQKSSIFQEFAKHPHAAPLAGVDLDATAQPRSKTKESWDSNEPGAMVAKPSAAGRDTAASTGSGAPALALVDDGWLPPDMEASTPKQLRHTEKIRNLRFSRKKVADFIDQVMQSRSRLVGSSQPNTMFLEFMMAHLAEEMNEEDAEEFAINIFAGVRRYSAEPDFLSYLLLILGKLPDTVVRDNKGLCAELLRIFTTHFETSDGTRNITKQKFFYGLREVLQNKDQKLWQDLVTYFPAGGPDVLVNYEWLLLDDLYILSPIVYALRLQHLEEVVNMADRLEKAVSGTLKEGSHSVKYGLVETVLREDPEFGLLQVEDYAKAFGTSVSELKPNSEQDVQGFLESMKQGDIFHVLFFPVLPSDDADLGGQGDMG